jgi:hypothetical protein
MAYSSANGPAGRWGNEKRLKLSPVEPGAEHGVKPGVGPREEAGAKPGVGPREEAGPEPGV